MAEYSIDLMVSFWEFSQFYSIYFILLNEKKISILVQLDLLVVHHLKLLKKKLIYIIFYQQKIIIKRSAVKLNYINQNIL